MIEIRNTENKGRGIFATREIHEGEVISTSPCIPISIGDITPDSNLWKYVFNYTNKIKLVSLDFTSIMNHDKNPNVSYRVISQTEIIFTASRNIIEGEELTIDYGYEVIKDIDWNRATTGKGPVPDHDSDVPYLYASEIPCRSHGKCSRVQMIDEYYEYRGKGKCMKPSNISLSYINRTGKYSSSPVILVEVPYSIQGLQGTLCNSEMIAKFARNSSKRKNRVLMSCFIIMRHMRNIYQRSSYYFDPVDYEHNLPSQDVANILNEDLELTGICMKIAYAVDFLEYLKRYPDRLYELENLSKPFKIKKPMKYKPDNHWSKATTEFRNMIAGLTDDCNIIYPDKFY